MKLELYCEMSSLYYTLVLHNCKIKLKLTEYVWKHSKKSRKNLEEKSTGVFCLLDRIVLITHAMTLRGPIFCRVQVTTHIFCVLMFVSPTISDTIFLSLYPLSHSSIRQGKKLALAVFSLLLSCYFWLWVTSSIFTLPRIVMIGSLFEA